MCFKSSCTIQTVAAISFCLIGGTVSAAAYADVGDQLFKLLPDDGAMSDEFGVSVAIRGTTAIVGAFFDDDNGDNSGSAYLFDTTPGGLIWFDNQAEFEAFNQGKGKVLKGTEHYEESVLPPGSGVEFDDPLESGVHCLPPGCPFPDGMTSLPYLIVQSNFEHNPANPNPRGLGGLLALANGIFGTVSDVVLSNSFGNGLDLIFTDEKTAVGFNTINVVVGGTAVNVRVYIESEFPAARVRRGEFQDLLKPILWIIGRCQARRPSRAV